MAKVKIQMPDEFLEKLAKLGDKTDVFIPEVLEAGGEVLLQQAKSNLSAVVGRGTKKKSHSTGELIASLGLSPAMQTRDGSGWDVKVGFKEPRSDGSSNAKIAATLEYGKHGQPAKPFMKPAKVQSERRVVDVMQEKFREEVEGL